MKPDYPESENKPEDGQEEVEASSGELADAGSAEGEAVKNDEPVFEALGPRDEDEEERTGEEETQQEGLVSLDHYLTEDDEVTSKAFEINLVNYTQQLTGISPKPNYLTHYKVGEPAELSEADTGTLPIVRHSTHENNFRTVNDRSRWNMHRESDQNILSARRRPYEEDERHEPRYAPAAPGIPKRLLNWLMRVGRENLALRLEFHRRFLYAMGLLLAVYILLSLSNLTQLWIFHHHGWNGARRTLNAINYERYGYIDTKLGPMDNRGLHLNKNGSPKKLEIYWHHPPLFALTLSVFHKFFGPHEWTARLMSALMSLGVFLFFWFSLRNHWGNAPTFYALTFLTFMPFYASYLNFVNYEALVLLCMAATIFFYEKFLITGQKRFAGLLFFAMFCGSYGDFPMFIWIFYFWLSALVRAIAIDRGQLKFLVYYVLATFAIVGLVALQLLYWHQGGYENLFHSRFNPGTPVSEALPKIFRKWKYYYGFFGPFAYMFCIYYLGDLYYRIRHRRLSRADGYLVAFLLTGITHLVALKQGHWVHTYFIIYLGVFIGLSSGYGLYRFLCMLRERTSIKRVHAIGAAICLLMILWSLPSIHNKFTNPIFEYTKHISKDKSFLKYDYGLDQKIAMMIARDNSKPDEHILLDASFSTDRNEFLFYLDREWKTIKNQSDFKRLSKQKKWKRLVFRARQMPSSFLIDLIKKYKFIAYKQQYIFDLTGKDFKRISVRRQIFHPQNDIERYFSSMVHGDFEIVDDPLMALDMAIKYDLYGEAAKLRRTLSKKNPPPRYLEEAVALYNNDIVQNRLADPKKIYAFVEKAEKPQRFGSISLIAQKLYRRNDGRGEVILVLKAAKPLQQNYRLLLEGIAKHENMTLKKRIDIWARSRAPAIPTSLWKPGLIYTLRMPLDLDPGPYELKVSFEYKDSIIAFNPDHNRDHFKIPIKDWDKRKSQINHTEKRIRKLVKELNRKALSPKKADEYAKKKKLDDRFKKVDLDGKFIVWAAFTKKHRKNKYKTSFLVMNLNMQPMDWMFEFKSIAGTRRSSKGKDKKPHSVKFQKKLNIAKQLKNLKQNQFFWIDINLDFDPRKKGLDLRAHTRANTKLLDRKGKIAKVSLSSGDWGIKHPFQFIQILNVDPMLR